MNELEAMGLFLDRTIKDWKSTLTEHARSHLSGGDLLLLRIGLVDAIKAASDQEASE